MALWLVENRGVLVNFYSNRVIRAARLAKMAKLKVLEKIIERW